METLDFSFGDAKRADKQGKPVLVGVVGSGNLEVLVEPALLDGQCRIEVHTAAVGFGTIWKAVLTDASQRWPLGDLRITINDAGATPAVVSLRIDQALQLYLKHLS